MFAVETVDDLQQYLDLCLELQKNPTKDTAKEILRIVHSIKGNAQIANFQEVSQLMHHCEEVLELSARKDFEGYEPASELLLTTHDKLLEWCNNLNANKTNNTNAFAETNSQLEKHLKTFDPAQAIELNAAKPSQKINNVKKVLVVDDDIDFIAVLQDAIESFSHAGISTDVEVC